MKFGNFANGCGNPARRSSFDEFGDALRNGFYSLAAAEHE